jgi:hypothetical protein
MADLDIDSAEYALGQDGIPADGEFTMDARIAVVDLGGIAVHFSTIETRHGAEKRPAAPRTMPAFTPNPTLSGTSQPPDTSPQYSLASGNTCFILPFRPLLAKS